MKTSLMNNKIYFIAMIFFLNISCAKNKIQYQNKSGLKIEIIGFNYWNDGSIL